MIFEPITVPAMLILAGLNAGSCDFNRTTVITKALIRPTKYNFHVGSSDDLHGAVGTASGNWQTEAKAEYTRDKATNCYYIKRLDVTIYHQPVISMLQKYAPGTCGHRYVMDHEQAHVRINRSMLRKFSEQIKIDLRKTMRRTRGTTSNHSSLFQVATKRLQEMTDQVVRDLDKVHKEQLDNPVEYQRVSKLIQNKCGL